jgi:hypothetical protein
MRALALAAALLTAACAAAPANGTIIQSNCREFTTTITIDGQPQQASGLACQQPDNSWRIVSEDTGIAPEVGAPPSVAYPYPYATAGGGQGSDS